MVSFNIPWKCHALILGSRILAIPVPRSSQGANPSKLDRFLHDARRSRLSSMQQSARTLTRDIEAVRHASRAWSSGQAKARSIGSKRSSAPCTAARVSSSCEHGCFRSSQTSTKSDTDPRKLRPDGVHMFGSLKYWHGALVTDLARSGREVEVKYDPRDSPRSLSAGRLAFRGGSLERSDLACGISA